MMNLSKLNSNKKQFLHSNFITFHKSSVSIPFLSFFFLLATAAERERNDKIIYQNVELFPYIHFDIYIKTSSIELNATRDLLMHSICINIIQISTPRAFLCYAVILLLCCLCCHLNWIPTSET